MPSRTIALRDIGGRETGDRTDAVSRVINTTGLGPSSNTRLSLTLLPLRSVSQLEGNICANAHANYF
jgi:hypothetical protein